MDLQLSGRTALVTGASAGIGLGIAKILAAEGVRVAITARRADRLGALADEIVRTGAACPVVVPGDLTSADGPAAVAAAARAGLGAIDILVNGAGGSRPLPPDAGDAEWDEAMNLNFTSVRRLTRAVMPDMRARRWGRIINISGAVAPRSTNAATSAKNALHSWARGLAADLGPEGITVNSVAPGRIRSEQIWEKLLPTEEARARYIAHYIPAGYIGEPEDLAVLVAFLASPLARYISGAIIPVDGAMHRYGL